MPEVLTPFLLAEAEGTVLEPQIEAIDGVEDVTVNQDSGRVTVAFDPARASVAELRATLEQALGFEVIDRGEPGSAETEDTEAAARRAEVADSPAGCWPALS